MYGMHTNRHHIGLGFCIEALSKGRCGSSLGKNHTGSEDAPLINLRKGRVSKDQLNFPSEWAADPNPSSSVALTFPTHAAS
eukprot:1136355-Pelagomonas_calceolata.AAC.5